MGTTGLASRRFTRRPAPVPWTRWADWRRRPGRQAACACVVDAPCGPGGTGGGRRILPCRARRAAGFVTEPSMIFGGGRAAPAGQRDVRTSCADQERRPCRARGAAGRTTPRAASASGALPRPRGGGCSVRRPATADASRASPAGGGASGTAVFLVPSLTALRPRWKPGHEVGRAMSTAARQGRRRGVPTRRRGRAGRPSVRRARRAGHDRPGRPRTRPRPP